MMTSRREIVIKRLNVILLDTIVDIQAFIEESLLLNESKEMLNKIYKQEFSKVIQEVKEDVFENANEH